MIPSEIKTRSQAKADGDKYYYTGVECKNGHDALRYTAGGHCVLCIRDINHKRRDYICAKHKEYVAQHTEEVRAYQREYHREYRKTNRRTMTEAEKEQHKKYTKAWRDRQRAAKLKESNG